MLHKGMTENYGHCAAEHQNPNKIKPFNRPFPEGFLAGVIARAKAVRQGLHT